MQKRSFRTRFIKGIFKNNKQSAKSIITTNNIAEYVLENHKVTTSVYKDDTYYKVLSSPNGSGNIIMPKKRTLSLKKKCKF